MRAAVIYPCLPTTDKVLACVVIPIQNMLGGTFCFHRERRRELVVLCFSSAAFQSVPATFSHIYQPYLSASTSSTDQLLCWPS
jgi:hypothetical protein